MREGKNLLDVLSDSSDRISDVRSDLEKIAAGASDPYQAVACQRMLDDLYESLTELREVETEVRLMIYGAEPAPPEAPGANLPNDDIPF